MQPFKIVVLPLSLDRMLSTARADPKEILDSKRVGGMQTQWSTLSCRRKNYPPASDILPRHHHDRLSGVDCNELIGLRYPYPYPYPYPSQRPCFPSQLRPVTSPKKSPKAQEKHKKNRILINPRISMPYPLPSGVNGLFPQASKQDREYAKNPPRTSIPRDPMCPEPHITLLPQSHIHFSYWW